MKKWRVIFAVCTVFLGGCAHFYGEARLGLEGFNPRVVRQPQPLFPNVFITNSGHIVVDQEPIRIGKREVGRDGRVTISWALAAGSPYTFPSNGIVIGSGPAGGAPPDLKCSVQGSLAKVFECSYRAPEGRYRYKYTVYVRRGNELLEALDPNITGGH